MSKISPMREKRKFFSETKEESPSRGKLTSFHEAPMKNVLWFPTMTPYYHMRAMTLAASLPDEPKIDISSPIADQPFSVAYTDAEREMITRAAKLCGFNTIPLSDKHSKEENSVHTVSPVSHSRDIF